MSKRLVWFDYITGYDENESNINNIDKIDNERGYIIRYRSDATYVSGTFPNINCNAYIIIGCSKIKGNSGDYGVQLAIPCFNYSELYLRNMPFNTTTWNTWVKIS